MKALIIGRNRVVIGKVDLKEWEAKHWYLCGTQLYKIYPEGLMRTIVTRYGKRKTDEEMIAYHENASIPYDQLTVSYDTDLVLSEIDEHKLMAAPRGGGLLDMVARNKRNLGKISGALPLLIAGAVLLYAVVGNAL